MSHLESDLIRWHILLLFVAICSQQITQAQTPTILSDTLIDYHQDQIVQLIPSGDSTRGMGYASIGFDRFASNRSFFLGHWKNDADLLSWEQGEYWLDDFPFAGWKYQNEYVMIGYRSLDSMSLHSQFRKPAVFVSMRIDSNNQQVWEDTTSGYEAPFDRAISLHDGSKLAVGKNRLALYRPDGLLLWHKKYFLTEIIQRFYGAVLLDNRIAVISKHMVSRSPERFSTGILFIDLEGNSLGYHEKQNLYYCDDLIEINGKLGAVGLTQKITRDPITSKLDTLSGIGISYFSKYGDSLSTEIFNLPLVDSLNLTYPFFIKKLHDRSVLLGAKITYQNGIRNPEPHESGQFLVRYNIPRDSCFWAIELPEKEAGFYFKDIAFDTNNEGYIVLRKNSTVSQTIRLARLSADQTLAPVSVAALPDLQVTAWPNPAKDKLWFHSEAQVRLSIKDISGRCIYEDKVQGKTLIHLEQPSPGIYFWIARDPTGNTAHGKIAIQR